LVQIGSVGQRLGSVWVSRLMRSFRLNNRKFLMGVMGSR